MRIALSMTLILALSCLASAAGAAERDQGDAAADREVAAADREVIVLMLIDALRPDHMGCYGYKKPTTPEMDKLAGKGRRYTRVYANAPWTRPSTTSFLTGLNASRHRTETAESKLPDDVISIAQRLKGAGYTTTAFVANGNGGSLAGLERDFDVFRDVSRTYTRKMRGKVYNGLPTGEFIVGDAMKWLKANKDEKKVFMFLFLVDPHDPYRAPDRLEKMFLDKNYKGTIRRNALWEINNNYPEAERRSMVAVYDASIRYADEAVGQFFTGLKSLGLDDESTVFISADHGEGFGEHGFYLHAHHFWDEVIKIPLLVIGNGFFPGVDNRLTQSLDVSATIVALAGADAKGLPGSSLLKPAPAGRNVISEYNEFGIHRQAIIGERYKVVWQRPADEEWYMRTARKKIYFPSVSFDKPVVRVYDMTNDPGETKDIAKQMPEEAKGLYEELERFVIGDSP